VQPVATPTHICQLWYCARCRRNGNWAEVVITDIIERIIAIRLNFAALQRLHLLDEDAAGWMADATGRDPIEHRNELVPSTRAWLAEDPAREL